MTPLGESGGPVELEMVSAVKVAFLVEVYPSGLTALPEFVSER